MAQKIIGLDLGTREVKVVLVEGSFKSFAVKGYFSAPVQRPMGDEPAPPEERLAEALKALRTEEGAALKADAVITSLPGSEVVAHVITLPFTDTRRIEQTLPFELEDQIPFDLSEVVFDYQILGQHDGQSDVLVAVAKRSVVEGLLEVLAGAGLDPRIVSLSSLAYQNLFAHGVITPLERAPAVEGEPPPPPRPEAVLDIGDTSTDLIIVEDGATRFVRSFPVAGRSLTLAVAAAKQLGADEAENLKIESGTLDTQSNFPDRAELAKVLQAGLAPLVRTVRQSFLAYTSRSRSRVERVYLTGGTARLPGLAEHLSRELGCEVVALDPFPETKVEVDVPTEHADDPAAGLAMALALRGHGGTRTARVNFRRGDLAFKGDLSYMKGNFTTMVALAAVVLAVLGVNVWAHLHTLTTREHQLDQSLCQLTQKVLGSCITDPDDAISRLKGQRAGSGVVPRVSAAEVLAAVSQRLSGMKDVDLSELDITGTKVRLTGEAGSFDAVAKMVDALKRYTCFSNVNQGQTRQARGGDKIEFNVDADMAQECQSS